MSYYKFPIAFIFISSAVTKAQQNGADRLEGSLVFLFDIYFRFLQVNHYSFYQILSKLGSYNLWAIALKVI